MLKGLSFLLLRALPLLLLSAPAWAGSTLYLNFLPGDPNGLKGMQYQLNTDDGTAREFTALTNSGANGNSVQTVEFTIFQSFTSNQFELNFAAPPGGSLTTGVYESNALGSPTTASLGTTMLSCQPSITRFVIRELTQTSAAGVTDFAADFEVDCAGAPAMVGSIRYNSALPLSIDEPTADAGIDQLALAGTAVTLAGSVFSAGNGTVTGTQWTQLSGPSVTLGDPSSLSTTFTAPAVDPGGADVVLQLEVDNSLSLSATDTVTIHIANAADPATAFYMHSDPGDPLTGGETVSMNSEQALFIPSVIGSGGVVTMAIEGGTDGAWSIKFTGPDDGLQTLQPGTYDPTNAGIDGPLAQLDVVEDSHGCDFTSPARFVIYDAQYSDNTLVSFAADFEFHCEGSAAALHGKLRYNSTYPFDDPVADVGVQTQTAITGDTVALSGTASDPGGSNNIVSYQWIQISGPSVTLSDPNAATTTFSAPDVTAGGEDLVFELTITSSDGLTSSEQITIIVANPSDPITGLYLQGDINGQSQYTVQELFQPFQGDFSIQTASGVVTVTFNDNMDNFWTASFAPPPGKKLQPGAYTGAKLVGQQGKSAPGINVGSGSSFEDCFGAVSGSFNILQISYDGSGNVTQLAADFVEHCNGDPQGLRGKVRYDSSVTLRMPTVDAGPTQSTYAGLPVLLDGSHTAAGFGSIASYLWTQVVKAGDPVVSLPNPAQAKLAFLAPAVPAGGHKLSFKLTATNTLGSAGQDLTEVGVGGVNDKKTALYYDSTPGDTAGLGMHGLLIDTAALSGAPHADADLSVSAGMADANVGLNGFWELTFNEGTGDTPKVGSFNIGTKLGSPMFKALASTSPCASSTGTYVVRDLTFVSNEGIPGGIPGEDEDLASLAVDFIQHCDGYSAVFRGAYRYNSTVPIDPIGPTAIAGPDQTMSGPGAVVLDGSASSANDTSIVNYSWKQLSGPTVQLTNASNSIASFNLQASAIGTAATIMVFQLKVTDSLGLSDTAQVTVTAQEQFSSSLSFQSDAGDDIGQGQTAAFSLKDHGMTVQETPGNGIEVTMPANGYWALGFAPKKGQPLKPGSYTGAGSFKPGGSPVPGLSVSVGNRRCAAVSGDFTLRDIQYQAGKVSSLAVDFDQFCDGSSAGLHGKLRYHSAVP